MYKNFKITVSISVPEDIYTDGFELSDFMDMVVGESIREGLENTAIYVEDVTIEEV